MGHRVIMPALERQRPEHHEFTAILSYILSSRLAWASKTKQNKTKQVKMNLPGYLVKLAPGKRVLSVNYITGTWC